MWNSLLCSTRNKISVFGIYSEFHSRKKISKCCENKVPRTPQKFPGELLGNMMNSMRWIELMSICKWWKYHILVLHYPLTVACYQNNRVRICWTLLNSMNSETFHQNWFPKAQLRERWSSPGIFGSKNGRFTLNRFSAGFLGFSKSLKICSFFAITVDRFPESSPLLTRNLPKSYKYVFGDF